MKPSWRERGLSIFGRTFLLMLAALLVAEGIGLTLLINRPPLHNAPVELSQIANALRPQGAAEPGRDSGPPPREDRGPSGGGFGPPPGPPPDQGHGPGSSSPRAELAIRESATAPEAPRDIDRIASTRLQAQLARLLGADAASVLLYVGAGDDMPGPANNTTLREGFVAAYRQPDGQWRIADSVVEGFPNAFHKQAMWLFAIGILVLLPLAWLFARALSAPIRRFSQAAKRLGNDPSAPPVPREGPTEMLQAVDSFNAMQARLNRLLQERTHMIGAIAHDLRTPLMRLSFRLDDLPEPLHGKVDADIQEMKAMISAALDFIRDRSLGAHHERLDFRLLVESVVDDQTDLGHDVTLQSGTPITMEGDPLALRRMVVNLVDNALKYGERARLRLRPAQAGCVLEIDDDGPGIPDALQHQIFEPFFRLEASRNRDTGGIGLGLATVRSIVLDHGGEVGVSNRKEGGLRATVFLPAAEAAGI